MGPFLLGFASIAYIVVCALLIIIVLMQESRGGGLASAFGGSGLDLSFGAGIGRKMSRFTVVLAVIFMVLSIILAVAPATKQGAPPSSRTHAGAPEQPAQEETAPAQPTAPEGGAKEAPVQKETPPPER